MWEELTWEDLTFPGGPTPNWRKENPSESLQNTGKTSLRRLQEKKKGLELLQHSRNIQNVENRQKKNLHQDVPKAQQKNKGHCWQLGHHWETLNFLGKMKVRRGFPRWPRRRP